MSEVSVKLLEPTFDDYGLGRMYRATDQRVFEYQPFEVSKLSLGVIAPQGLSEGSRMVLDTQMGRIELEVEGAASAAADSTGLARYRLTTHDPRVDMERVFTQSGCHRKLAMSDRKIQCARFEVTPHLIVRARTFGARDHYSLSGVNISKSGLLMHADARDRVPFIINTLLEVQLEGGNWLREPVACLAKVVRNEVTTEDGQRVHEFGIKFIEFSDHGMEVWKDAITNIEFNRHNDDLASH